MGSSDGRKPSKNDRGRPKGRPGNSFCIVADELTVLLYSFGIGNSNKKI